MNTFHDITDEHKLNVARNHLAGKVKCSACNRHYVNPEEGWKNARISENAASKSDTRLASIEKLTVSRWIGFDAPESITMDLLCYCGHGGLYTLSPNPFITLYK